MFLNASDLSAKDMSAKDLSANYLSAKDLSASALSANDLSTSDFSTSGFSTSALEFTLHSLWEDSQSSNQYLIFVLTDKAACLLIFLLKLTYLYQSGVSYLFQKQWSKGKTV